MNATAFFFTVKLHVLWSKVLEGADIVNPVAMSNSVEYDACPLSFLPLLPLGFS